MPAPLPELVGNRSRNARRVQTAQEDYRRDARRIGRARTGERIRMAYEMKPNSGSLFKNDRKESDSHPDYKGQALIEGVNYWLDAWINTTNSGDKYMSLKLKPKEARGGGGGYVSN